ncbi:colony stimulating factor 3 (granulocyte) b [Aplochiton taeniatus]
MYFNTVLDNSEFKESVENAKTLIAKILVAVPGVHDATVSTEDLTFNPPSQLINLQAMVMSLGIPKEPLLTSLSQEVTLEMSVSRMSVGVHLYQDLLGALEDKLGDKLGDIPADLQNLQEQLHKMQKLGQMSSVEQYQRPDLSSGLDSEFLVQVATHITLLQLRDFSQDLTRTLRHITSYRPRT